MYRNPYKGIGKKIKEARLEKGLSQEELAQRIGISRRSLHRLENGDRYTMDWVEMCLLQEILEIDIEPPKLCANG